MQKSTKWTNSMREIVWPSRFYFGSKLYAALFSLMLVGCAAPNPYQVYEGPRQSDADHAYVTGESEKFDPIWMGANKQVYIRKVDGNAMGFLSTPRTYPRTVLLMPGRHVLGLLFLNMGIFAEIDMPVDVQAGRSYFIRRAFAEPIAPGNVIRFWLEDITAEKATKIESSRKDENRIEIVSE
jgi:hypothetical protein